MNYQFGLTAQFPCSYLANQQERLLVAVDEELQSPAGYAFLMSQGFRRGGEQIYRPHCINCQACRSIRVLASQFKPSKSQKRVIAKNRHFRVNIATTITEDYYLLYQLYINTVHKDGAMYPATKAQFNSFILENKKLTNQLFIEVWHNEQLISVAVTDELFDALSAVYTFYHPDYKKSAIGVFSILSQLQLSKKLQKKYLYLGYQIDECKKMNYKNRYFPYEIFQENNWQLINK
jgi:arginine-tRNA-protein transferase